MNLIQGHPLQGVRRVFQHLGGVGVLQLGQKGLLGLPHRSGDGGQVLQKPPGFLPAAPGVPLQQLQAGAAGGIQQGQDLLQQLPVIFIDHSSYLIFLSNMPESAPG